MLLPLLACQAQPEAPDDLALLAKIKARMAENLARLPNYTCSEQIERSIRPPRARKFQPVDTVRLEVALVDGKELYGWPGSHSIVESELSHLVGGTIGNGDFALLARSIFRSPGVRFIHQGSEGNPAAIRFDYDVPLPASAYHLQTGTGEAVVPYHGSVWVDPQTLDLVRVELVVDRIPEPLGIASCRKMLEYRRLKIGSSDFLLPVGSDLSMVDSNGAEDRNRLRFHGCRQYSGESVLSFDDPAAVAESAKKEIRLLELPADFQADLALVTPIDSQTAAVGDEIQARLQHSIRSGKDTIVPKGALLTVRIVEARRSERFFQLGLSFQSLDFEGAHADLSTRQNRIRAEMSSPSTGRRVSRGYVPVPIAPSGALIIEGDRVSLGRGFALSLRSTLGKSEKE